MNDGPSWKDNLKSLSIYPETDSTDLRTDPRLWCQLEKGRDGRPKRIHLTALAAEEFDKNLRLSHPENEPQYAYKCTVAEHYHLSSKPAVGQYEKDIHPKFTMTPWEKPVAVKVKPETKTAKIVAALKLYDGTKTTKDIAALCKCTSSLVNTVALNHGLPFLHVRSGRPVRDQLPISVPAPQVRVPQVSSRIISVSTIDARLAATLKKLEFLKSRRVELQRQEDERKVIEIKVERNAHTRKMMISISTASPGNGRGLQILWITKDQVESLLTKLPGVIRELNGKVA